MEYFLTLHSEYDKLDTYLHLLWFLCHVTSDVKFFPMFFNIINIIFEYYEWPFEWAF